MDLIFEKRCYRLPPREIGYLRFVLEAYDGLAFARTLDARAGLVEIAWPPSRSADAEALLAALRLEIDLVPAAAPDDYVPL